MVLIARTRSVMMPLLSTKNRIFTSTARSVYWEDLLPRVVTMNVWGDNGDIVPLGDISLDKSTRHVLQLLQQLHLGTAPRGSIDRASTARCHCWIERCNNAARADAILQGMELFRQRSEDRMVLPHPSSDTYLMVLRQIAKDTSVAPQRAEAIVERMQERYLEMGELQIRPTAIHWNQVLSSWAISEDEEKSYHAAKLLQRLEEESVADAASYSHVMRACALSYATDKGRKLGSAIAVKIYREARDLQHSDPHIFALFIKACAYMQDVEARDKLINQCFSDCRTAGLLNINVLHEFLKAASKKLQLKQLLHHRIQDDPHIQELLRRLPEKDQRNVKTKRKRGRPS